jgi:hypothetical protein
MGGGGWTVSNGELGSYPKRELHSTHRGGVNSIRWGCGNLNHRGLGLGFYSQGLGELYHLGGADFTQRETNGGCVMYPNGSV